MRPEDYSNREEEILGWKVRISSYGLGERYHATIENVDPGARIARAEGSTREQAEGEALEQAHRRLARTRRFSPEG